MIIIPGFQDTMEYTRAFQKMETNIQNQGNYKEVLKKKDARCYNITSLLCQGTVQSIGFQESYMEIPTTFHNECHS